MTLSAEIVRRFLYIQLPKKKVWRRLRIIALDGQERERRKGVEIMIK